MIRRLLLSLFLCLPPLAAQVKPLTILHSNDLHAHLMPDDQDNGGFARLATEVRRQKTEGVGAAGEMYGMNNCKEYCTIQAVLI